MWTVAIAAISDRFARARTGWDWIALLGPILGFFAFFLPWTVMLGTSLSGAGIASRATALLWLLPLWHLAAFAAECRLIPPVAAQYWRRVGPAGAAFLSGAVLTLIGISSQVLAAASFGIYLSAAAVLAEFAVAFREGTPPASVETSP